MWSVEKVVKVNGVDVAYIWGDICCTDGERSLVCLYGDC